MDFDISFLLYGIFIFNFTLNFPEITDVLSGMTPRLNLSRGAQRNNSHMQLC